MSCNDTAIRVDRVSKMYRIFDRPEDRLKEGLFSRWGKRYSREFWALKDISFEARKGESIGIVGRNGAGKSTLLQIIAGILHPTSGTVQVDGRVSALLELGSGFNLDYTGRENVYMNTAILGLTTAETDARFDAIASFADIGQFLDQPVKTYSSGMLMRLAFAVQVAVNPSVMIVDEALSVGDVAFQRKCFARLEALKNNGMTLLFVSHVPQLVVQLCDRALLLEDGESLMIGPPGSVTKQYGRLVFSKPEHSEAVKKAIRDAAASGAGVHAPSDGESREHQLSSFAADLITAPSQKYESNGGEILHFELQNSEGRAVNAVTSGFAGTVRLRARFNRDCEDVIFGFHIKTVTGLELAGLAYRPGDSSPVNVKAGETWEAYWNVKLALTAGTYFFTFGVRSASQVGFIHRIIDAMAVKIAPNPDSTAFCIFDISNGDESGLEKLDA